MNLENTARPLGLAAMLLMLLSACKASPCSDDNIPLPTKLAELPILDEDASVCNTSEKGAKQESAMIMRWGEDMAPLQTKLMVEMDSAGWGQRSCAPPGMDHLGLDPNKICFEKGEQFFSASFQLGDSKQLGIERPAIITQVVIGGK